jgi:hypothetical protein
MSANTSKGQIWGGRVASALPCLMLFFSASLKLRGAPEIVEGFTKQGWPAGALVPIGILEVLCTIIYIIPQTAVLGAILVTAYLGGAVATHVHNGDGADKIAPAVVLGILVWVGLYLRDTRLRALVPLRNPEAG